MMRRLSMAMAMALASAAAAAPAVAVVPAGALLLGSPTTTTTTTTLAGRGPATTAPARRGLIPLNRTPPAAVRGTTSTAPLASSVGPYGPPEDDGGGGGGGGGAGDGTKGAPTRGAPSAAEGGEVPVPVPASGAAPPAASVGMEAPAPSAPSPSAPASSSSSVSAAAAADGAESALSSVLSRLGAEIREVGSCSSTLLRYVFRDDDDVKPEDIVRLCDDIESVQTGITDEVRQLLVTQFDLRDRTLRAARYETLNKLMRKDYGAYVATASFLSPGRIPREELPNVQDVPLLRTSAVEEETEVAAEGEADLKSEDGLPIVADCTLDAVEYRDSPLDRLLLKIFRGLVEKNTGGVSSDKEGIQGLLEQGRTFMLRPGQTPEAQHKMVYDTLGGLMTPYLPPFYRVFMSGVVPQLGTDWDGKKLGPWFYAPWLTSVVTPTFFGFLVGPSRPNSRKDGRLGGLVVEKCKFLQESGCKGLCLHQCKLPAQQFFREELGMDLSVSPNFVTQECQWSFGEVPLPPEDDPSFPRGCLVGCESRRAMAGTYADALG